MMRGGELIREARRRAGLSQKDVAEALGTTQPVVARWETGRRSPSYERLVQAIRACGFDLAVRIVRPDEGHDGLIDEALALPPEERLDRLMKGQNAMRELVEGVRGTEDSNG